jgi:3-isopropylmalate dehydrogenase
VGRLWRRVVERVASEWEGPPIEHDHVLADRMAMELVLRPTHFDVIVTSNLFGDILSDEAAAVVGSLGLLPSASLGGDTDLYEPVHGSAPDIAGRGVANPTGAIASVALMLRHTFGMETEAARIERSLDAVYDSGIRTPDLGGTADTRAFAAAVASQFEEMAT